MKTGASWKSVTSIDRENSSPGAGNKVTLDENEYSSSCGVSVYCSLRDVVWLTDTGRGGTRGNHQYVSVELHGT